MGKSGGACRHGAVPAALVPAVRSYVPGGRMAPFGPDTTIVVDEGNAGLCAIAELLACELVGDGHLDEVPRLAYGRPGRPGDIVLEVAPVTDHPEGYRMTADGVLTIAGPTTPGVFWGTRTLVQWLRSEMPSGTVLDWPELSERALMIDIGRKHFAREWLEELVGQLAFLKLNTLQLHVSDGLGYRIECPSHPEIVSGEHLSLDDLRSVQAVARRYHVVVNGDVDSPGHLDHVLARHPEFRLRLADGRVHDGHLDYSMPGARALLREIVVDACRAFDGPVFHLGGDEYFPAPWQGEGSDVVSARTAPQLVEYAREVTGNPAATIVDGYEAYLNELADLVGSFGKTARIWNDDIRPGGGINRIAASTQADVWIRWNRLSPTSADYARVGHALVNGNGDYLYFILTGDGLGTGPTKHPRGIYENWTPRTFMGAAGNGGDFVLPDEYPVLGSHLSVWCDAPGSMTPDEVRVALIDWLRPFAQQAWGSPKQAGDYADFVAIANAAGEAPVVADGVPVSGTGDLA